MRSTTFSIENRKLERYIRAFLDGMHGGEKLPNWVDDGMCHSMTFQVWRASVIGEANKHLERLDYIAGLGADKLKLMGNILAEYNRFNASAIEDVLAPFQKKLKIVNTQQERELIKKEMQERRDKFYAAEEVAARDKLFFESHGYGKEELKLLELGKEFYTILNSTVSIQKLGSQTDFKVGKRIIKQSDYLSHLDLLAPDKVQEHKAAEKKSAEPKPFLAQTYLLAFSFQSKELEKTLEQVVREGDFIRVAATDHNLFLTRINGNYELYNSNFDEGVQKYASAKALVKAMEDGFFGDFDEDSTYMPIAIQIYEKSNLEHKQGRRPEPVKIVKDILDKRDKSISIDEVSWDKTTALLMATEFGCKEIVEELLKRGAMPEIRDTAQQAPLQAAARGGFVEIIEMLMKAGNINIDYLSTKLNATAVGLAAAVNEAPAIKVLAEYKADVNKRGKSDVKRGIEGQAPIHGAARRGNLEAIQMLVKCNAKMDVTWEGSTPVMLAIEQGNVETLKCLIDLRANLEITNNQGLTPVMLAIKKGHDVTLSVLAEGKADLNAATKNEIAPIFNSALSGNVEILNLLKKYGADIRKPDADQWTALHYAAQEGHIDFIKKLVEYKAELDGVTTKGNSAIFIAAQVGHVQAISVLCESKANVNLANQDGLAPAHIAVHAGQFAVLQVLAKGDADFNKSDKDGETPLQLAIKASRWDMVVVMLASLRNAQDISPAVTKMLVDNQKPLGDAFIGYAKSLDEKSRQDALDSLFNSSNSLADMLKIKKAAFVSFLSFGKNTSSELDRIASALNYVPKVMPKPS